MPRNKVTNLDAPPSVKWKNTAGMGIPRSKSKDSFGKVIFPNSDLYSCESVYWTVIYYQHALYVFISAYHTNVQSSEPIDIDNVDSHRWENVC